MTNPSIPKPNFELIDPGLTQLPCWCHWTWGQTDTSEQAYQVSIEIGTGKFKRAHYANIKQWGNYLDAKELLGKDRGLGFFATPQLEGEYPEQLLALVRLPGIAVFTQHELLVPYHDGATALEERLEAIITRRAEAPADETQANVPLVRHIFETMASTPELLLQSLEHLKPTIIDLLSPEATSYLWQYSQPGWELYAAAINQYLWTARVSATNQRLLKRVIGDWGHEQIETLINRVESMADYDLNPPVPPPYQHDDLMAKAGVTVLAGRPKMGKSYLALNLALAIAEGGMFASRFELGYPGAVLYLALEDHKTRMYSRLKAISANQALPKNFYVAYQSPRISGTFAHEIKEWLDNKADENPRLIVIDVFNHVQTQRGKDAENLYDLEYRDMRVLADLATEYDLHIMLVTHLNKNHSNVEDARDAVMSSTAITGGASGIWILSAENNGLLDAKLNVSGKDIPLWDVALRRIQLQGHMDWEALGDIKEVGAKSLRTSILIGLYKWNGVAPSKSELHRAINPDYSRGSFINLLTRMQKDNLIRFDNGKVQLTNQGASQASAEIENMPDPDDDDD